MPSPSANSPQSDPRGHQHGTELAPKQKPGEIAGLVSSCLDFSAETLADAAIARNIAHYAWGKTPQGFGSTESRILSALAHGFLREPKVEAGSREVFCSQLTKVLRLTDHASALALDTQALTRLETAARKFSTKPSNTQVAFCDAMLTLAPALSSVPAWIGLFETAARKINGPDTIKMAIRKSETWGSPQLPIVAEARAALVQYLMSHGRAERREASELAALRNEQSTTFGDLCRTAILRLASQERGFADSSFLVDTLRFIESGEQHEPSAVVHLTEILANFGSAIQPAQEFLSLMLDTPIDDVSDLLLKGADLISAKYPMGVLSPHLLDYFYGERLEALKLHSDDQHVRRLADGVAVFLTRLGLSHREDNGKDLVEAMSELNAESALRDPRHAEKYALILEGKNLPPRQRCDTLQAALHMLLELKTHALIIRATHTSDATERNVIEEAIASPEVASSDNPPFSLKTTPRDVQLRFMSQIRGGYRRMADGYYGFWSQTFPMRRSPVTQTCYFDNFAEAVGGNLKVIVARDIHRFPGRGRIVEGLKPELIFAVDPADLNRDPLHRWKKNLLADFAPQRRYSDSSDVHPLDDLAQTRFAFMRGMKAVTVPGSDAWVVNGEHMTYVEYNHHFDASGVHMAFLFPTRALWSFIDPHAVAYRPGNAFPEQAKGPDICDNPPTVSNIRARCAEMRTRVGVINLGTGSNYFGGFCNGVDIGSFPHHGWEKEFSNYRDNFGHLHKWHIRERTGQLAQLLEFHERINEIFLAGSRRLDVFKIADSMYAWGQTNLRPSSDDPWQGQGDDESGLGLGEYEPSRPFVLREADQIDEIEGAGGYGADSDWRGRALFMMEFAAKWMAENRAAAIPKAQAPLLLLTPTIHHARVVASPFIFDLASGFMWRRGEPPFMNEFNGLVSEEIEGWWREKVAPFAFNTSWVTPRLVARENYLDQLHQLGATI